MGDLGDAGSLSSKGRFIRCTERNGEIESGMFSAANRLDRKVVYPACSGRATLEEIDGGGLCD